jgi:hypothetical protein
MPNLSHRPGQLAINADWMYWPAFRRHPDTHRLLLTNPADRGHSNSGINQCFLKMIQL